MSKIWAKEGKGGRKKRRRRIDNALPSRAIGFRDIYTFDHDVAPIILDNRKDVRWLVGRSSVVFLYTCRTD